MVRQCSVNGCYSLVKTRNLCSMHYQRLNRVGSVGSVGPRRLVSDGHCSVSGCKRIHYAKGLCNTHYTRVRTNGTLDLCRVPNGESLGWLFDVALMHQDEYACLKWPFLRNDSGYGTIWYKGRNRLAHRIICQKFNGKPPTKEHLACHTCGKGHEGCVNQHHLYWGTHKQNSADSAKHGTRARGENNGASKLTDKIVRRIIHLADKGWPNKRIAREFGVSLVTIFNIRTGKTWKHVER